MSAATPTVGRPGDPAAVRSLVVDDVTAIYVVDGVLAMSPEKFFPEVPSEGWADLRTPTGDLLMSVGGLLVRVAGTTVLFDAGVGAMTASFGLGSADCGSMLDVMGSLGIRPEDVDVLALTHLHFDHSGWVVTDGAKTFPNARYVLAAQEWAPYLTDQARVSDVTSEQVVAALSSGRIDIEVFGDGDEILPGVRALVTPPATPRDTRRT
jgi:glyoxylase-like metal-dependent hydrolase (beta-lactamase superfamily II)